tara:strand:+ start:1003 stop:1464 length:462 start_codon:yes stop_codon:yes gene_type:complete
MEIWKSIKDYENYEVSNLGRVKSIRNGKDVFLKFRDNGKGYNVSALYNKGVRKDIKVHRLVAINFIENKYNKPQVNHINGIKSDNNSDNLEWCTNKENTIHSYSLGLQKTKLTKEDVNYIRNDKITFQKDLALMFKVSHQLISKIKRNERRVV